MAFSEKSVAFKVSGNSASDPIVIFIHTSLNKGNFYDVFSGLFTAPYLGLYSFTVQFCSAVANGEQAIFTIRKNGNDDIASTALYYHESIACTSATGITELETGDVVGVVATPGNRLSHSTNNQFMGFLIQQYI